MHTDTQHLAAGCLVLNREKTKVLVVYHEQLHKWIIPGGHVESHEAPHEAAVRETKEETGIDVHLLFSEQPLTPDEPCWRRDTTPLPHCPSS